MSIEVMKQWLECVERCDAIDGMYSWSDVVDSLRQAIEQAETKQINSATLMSLTSPPRQPLTKYEINCIKLSVPEDDGVVGFARAVEAAHGIEAK